MLSITATLAAASAFGQAGSLETEVYSGTTDAPNFYRRTNNAGTELPVVHDEYKSTYGTESATAMFGSVHIDHRLSMPPSDNLEDKGSGSRAISSNFVRIFPAGQTSSGHQAKARFTINFSGDFSGSWGGSAGGSIAYTAGVHYNTSVILGTDLAVFQGSILNGRGFVGTPPSSRSSFTVDVPIDPDRPGFYLQLDVVAGSTGSSAGAPNPGGPTTSATFNMSIGNLVVADENGEPVDFTADTTFGVSKSSTIAAGGSFKGLSLTNTSSLSLRHTTLTLLDGTATRITHASVSFLSQPDPAEILLASDAASLGGLGVDQFVVQMDYDPQVASSLGGESKMRLAYRDPFSGKWANAVSANTGGTPKLINGAYDPAADFHLGYFGVDTVNHVVWAVLNHDGEFGVGAVADPAQVAPIDNFTATGPASNGGQIHFSATCAPGLDLRVQFTTIANPTSDPDDQVNWTPLLDGGRMVEQPANSGQYVLDSSAYPAGTNISFRVLATKKGLLNRASAVLGKFTLHPNPDLSPTIFRINESDSPVAGLADTVLRFTATQTKRPAGLIVRVQVSTNGTDWSDLPDNNGGLMGYDPVSGKFVLNSTSYPLEGAVSFRVISSAAGKSDSISNQIGVFNLTSSKPHLTPPVHFFTGNGNISDLDFHAVFPTDPGPVAVRIQATTTPTDEFSWTDLNNSTAGYMARSIDPLQFRLLINAYPQSKGVYFRAIASQDGAVDGRSLPCGPFDITPDIPPTVQIIPPPAQSGDGTQGNPYVISGDSLIFAASATPSSGRYILGVALQLDGATVGLFKAADGTVTTPMPVIGDHVLEVYAIDDLGGTARAGSGATFVRVVPGGGTSSQRISSDTATATAATGSAGGKVYTLVTSDGGWSDPTTWRDEQGNNGVPGPNDLAVIGNESVRFTDATGGYYDVTVKSVTLNGTHVIGLGNLTVTGMMTINSATFGGYMGIFIEKGAVCEFANRDDITFVPDASGSTAVFYNRGTINVLGAGGASGFQQFTNSGVTNFFRPLQTPDPAKAAVDPNAGNRTVGANKVDNTGKFSALGTSSLIGQDGSNLISQDGGGLIGNAGGTLIGNAGGTVLPNDGATLVSHDGGSIVSRNGAGLLSHDGSGLLSHDGSGLLSHDGSGLVGTGNTISSLRRSGGAVQRNIKAATAASAITQTGGEINLNGVTLVGPVILNGGILSGSGLIIGDLTNNSGYISPGHSAGRIGVIGNFAQGKDGTLVMENGGYLPGQFDQLQVSGSATLGGKLDVKTINGYQPGTQDTFSPLVFASATGSLSVSSNANATITATGLITSVDITKPQPRSGQPLNISTRMKVLSGDNALIAGFIVTGPSGSSKKVLIRGIGPSLANFGVAGTISDPLVELHKPDGTVVTNDNWQQGDTSQIPNGFAPSDPRESAVVATLTPGNYSAVLKGAHGETGVGLAEVYDLDSSSAAQLANISTRGFVNTGDDVMIGGFIIGGTEPAKVLVRAIGPSLAAFGVKGALPATTLEVHDANGAVISNEGWRATQEADIIATTIPPNNDNEAALLATLVPGNYTAVVRGKNNTTGIGLVEAYNLQ